MVGQKWTKPIYWVSFFCIQAFFVAITLKHQVKNKWGRIILTQKISENKFTVHCLTFGFILHVHKIKATFSRNLFVIVKLWKCFQTLLLSSLDLSHKTSNLYLVTDLQWSYSRTASTLMTKMTMPWNYHRSKSSAKTTQLEAFFIVHTLRSN